MVKSKKSDEITVPVQSMFPNCQKYDPCCRDVGMEKTMKKVDKINPEKIYNINILKKIEPVKKNPFPEDEEW